MRFEYSILMLIYVFVTNFPYGHWDACRWQENGVWDGEGVTIVLFANFPMEEILNVAKSPKNCLQCELWQLHCSDVIMSTMASQITSLMIFYSTVYSGTDQRKHQSSASLAFVWGIHRCPAQRATNTENVSIWWRHHETCGVLTVIVTLQEVLKISLLGIGLEDTLVKLYQHLLGANNFTS